MRSALDRILKYFKDNPSISIDSRDIKKNDIFFAIRGERFDGNKYAHKSLENGASVAVVDDPDLENVPGCIYVEDSLKALQEMAHRYRKTLQTTIIAITGSNGKTTTKELIGHILDKKYKTYTTQGNLNNHIGVPLTLLRIRQDTEYAVVEMGANHPGEIGLLSAIAEPDYGIITNIGKAHLEGFGGFEGVIKTKSELYKHIRQHGKKVFLNADNQLLNELSDGLERIKFGSGPGLFCKGEMIRSFPYVDVEIESRSSRFIVQSKLTGGYNFENILAAVCIGLYFKVGANEIKRALAEYVPANNRSQVLETTNNLLILDAYNANPSSMEAAIAHFSSSDYSSKALILGEMLELGDVSEEEHQLVVERVEKLGFDEVFFVGRAFKGFAKKPVRWFLSTDQLIEFLQKSPLTGKTILIKGSRGNALERVVKFL
ncbi:MAG: UDP-N-acetylmuramoyl-tripeptide--D-alanyl-D-alanine ligase [Bacteroidetes bacterium]|nr:UDP-N-acetylmuramoyl-tripeptide--D-alanyl-D-alanine ligase [Bacteroidota bacterium]